MQTERLYYEYTSGAPFQGEIREIRPLGEDRMALILDRTIFYPEGGGQSGDRGTIQGFPLVDVQERGGEIFHIISAGDGKDLIPGPAELVLDTRRRRDFTVHHTAQHLLSGTILRLFGKPTVSMHLGDEVCTIDVDTPEFPEKNLVAAEEAVADAIEGDFPVIIHLCPPERVDDFPLRKVPPQNEEVIRVVEIRENDFSPCCGTHLERTGQIGILRVLGAEKYKGMTRIFFIAGRRVLRDSRLLRQNGETASRALKVPVAETGRGVLALLERAGQLERDLKARDEELAEYQAGALLRELAVPPGKNAPPVDNRIVKLIFTDRDIEEAVHIGRAAEKLSGRLILAVSRRDLKFAALCASKTWDLRALLQNPMTRNGGRGGGGPAFFQGVFPGPAELEAFLQAIPEEAGAGSPGSP
ncbi:MAG: alanyl-tRNA editing protein [Treponema sp.]|jgi:alanyl-tRNA synthetase|nr:alanyl-tRNA editing protein [Treponema sp.]